ncbi:hypothetical protein Q5P01_022550 [Channa striata]|uniref:Uncharacterized protein n=1 Tax=Channa striata TaxID=64152 RepID=A0AA88IWD0_CHASR|nr:hypothetical protein Q5P01_022550 [Channa striata]
MRADTRAGPRRRIPDHLPAVKKVEHAAEPQPSLCDPPLSFWGPLVKKGSGEEGGGSWCRSEILTPRRDPYLGTAMRR